MESADVIELGSSDDDTEPEPKKSRTIPNVMVHIPQKLPGVTIKPMKRKASPLLEKLASTPVTVTKIKTANINPYANRNRNHSLRNEAKKHTVMRNEPRRPVISNKLCSPITNSPRIKLNSQLLDNGLPANTAVKQLKIQSVPVNCLLPNITVKRAPINVVKPIVLPGRDVSITKKVMRTLPKKAADVPTVELDDDDCPPSTAGNPQWYIRPEEQAEKESKEQENNKEPNKSQIIEITIEDSPVKPFKDKIACDIGTELAIIIEDSPLKILQDKNTAKLSSSEDETAIHKKKNSKKKLEYPSDGKTIEIELEPVTLDMQNKASGESVKQEIEVSFPADVVETQENSSTKPTPLVDSQKLEFEVMTVCKKSEETELGSVSKEKTTGMAITSGSGEAIEIKDKDDNEFHPVYQSFIDLCFKLENSDDMQKIVEKKIKAYYRQTPTDYTYSEAFIDMVSSKIDAIKASPEKMYLYIKDIVDELNLQRKMAKSQVTENIASKEESNKFLYGEDSEFDSKRQRQIRKLEKTLKKLHRAIQLLEEQEVDFDDEDDSVYLLTERYKERMVRVHAKFCQLTNTKMPSEPRVLIDVRPGQPAGPAKRLEKWINRKVPIGTPLPFPDFHDVLCCVREANEEDKLGWNEAIIMEEARDLFTRCGKKLQRRRQENEWRLAFSRISVDEDPAEKNEDLKKKLEINKNMASKKEADVFNKYVDRQNLLKLEAVEIGDKEAEESPVESDEEDKNDETALLLNKEKRKERLKRLLHEKSKKITGRQDKEVEEDSKAAEICLSEGTEEVAIETTEDKENKNDNEVKAVETEYIESSQDKVHNVSDDSSKIDSDIDELHLLEKLHSEKEIRSSTPESSDSETPIAISDTLSSGDNDKEDSDVISIEDSSYSESEAGKDKDEEAKFNDVEIENNEIETTGQNVSQTNHKNYDESEENILLASSEEENGDEKVHETCITLEKNLSEDSDVVKKDHKNSETYFKTKTDTESKNEHTKNEEETLEVLFESNTKKDSNADCVELEKNDNSDDNSKTNCKLAIKSNTEEDSLISCTVKNSLKLIKKLDVNSKNTREMSIDTNNEKGFIIERTNGNSKKPGKRVEEEEILKPIDKESIKDCQDKNSDENKKSNNIEDISMTDFSIVRKRIEDNKDIENSPIIENVVTENNESNETLNDEHNELTLEINKDACKADVEMTDVDNKEPIVVMDVDLQENINTEEDVEDKNKE